MLAASGLRARQQAVAFVTAVFEPCHAHRGQSIVCPVLSRPATLAASHVPLLSTAVKRHETQQRWMAQSLQMNKQQLKAARKQMKQGMAELSPQQKTAHEMMRKHGTDNPTMLVGYWDPLAAADRPWRLVPSIWWLRKRERRAECLEEWLRSAVVWQQLTSASGQKLIDLVKHAQKLFVTVKQQVVTGKPQTVAVTAAVAEAYNDEAAQRREKGFRLKEWTLNRTLRADDVRVLQLRIVPGDKQGKATVQYRVHEGITFSTERKSLEHDPVWVLLKRIARDESPGDQNMTYGGWRLSARLRDKSTPSGVGPEVKVQIPPPEMRAKQEQMWETQKVALKGQQHTVMGWAAKLMLR